MQSNTSQTITLGVSAWVHPICRTCYNFKYGRIEPFPARYEDLNSHAPVPCCWCGNHTKDGVVMRADPRMLDCKH